MHRLKQEPKVIGTKQTIRALDKGIAETLFVAKNAQKQVTLRALELAERQGIDVVFVDTMEELAKACEVEVETATAALIKN
ncbi:large subunit ribosomal protein L7A [Natranaerovirga pectinivora]|uniref:Large subunit ribosomal protein L7A n=1 Tax=Natranaerovirga pectinivora TaxID=682400 RepID=A0A4R3MIQ9_9FIRM|nr:ribosomal L7Ae/L30e/S12e/Gadd45 family protein [Natranaerovirga pectinivora]TCT14057.1 large subunit ribosomal protein L7A [Natranaerovirga pectinivora]